MATTAQPRTQTEWLKRLESLQPPINPAVREAALELFAAGASAGELASQLERDPALVFLLFREANRALARYDREAHTLEHAVGLLGAGRMQKIFDEAVPLDPQHPRAEAYRQALLRSQHAAAQARLWAEGSGLWPADEVFWSTLLAASPFWLLTMEAGAALETLGKLRAQHGAISRKQSEAALGCDVQALGAELTGRWSLPHMTQLSWQEKGAGSKRQWALLARTARLDEPPLVSGRELGELCHHPALVVALANLLATETDWDWHSERTLRLLSAAAAACRRPLATIISFSHQVAAKVSRDHADSGLLTPAARLLCHWNQTYCWVKPAPDVRARTTASSTVAPESRTSPGNGERLLAAVVQRLREPAKIGGTRAALELALKALHDGIGLRRVAVMLVRPQNRELQTVLSAGAEQAPALRQFRFLSQNNQLLTQLLSKPVCLLLDAGNRDKYWQHFPEDFRAAIGCDNFLMMTVFAKDRPVALVYADNKHADNAAQPIVSGARQHQLFKQFCQQLSQCLGHLS